MNHEKTAYATRRISNWAGVAAVAIFAACLGAQEQGLRVAVDNRGDYTIGTPQDGRPALASGVAAQVDGQWLRSSSYPRHSVEQRSVEGFLGAAEQWMVTFSGLAGKPLLIYTLRQYQAEPFVDLQVSVANTEKKTVEVESIRLVDADAEGAPQLGAPEASDRVLSDSFSEDRPAMQIRELGNAQHGMHRAVGSQLIYNRQSRESLFIGALSSERFLTILRLHVNGTGDAARIVHYEADSTGTTEMEKENSLADSEPSDQIELRLPVNCGESLPSETLLIGVGKNYHRQLERYGALIRRMHHARVTAPPLMGWWSWTAYYFGLNEGAALTNAVWEAEHLKSYGYNVFHIDEGYQYARGEYMTEDVRLFPNGLGPVEYAVRGMGLTPGIWTAPFEVSARSSVYRQHPDWLVKNAAGQPIHSGFVVDGKDPLYILDTTNPGAQQYLRETYRKLTRQWDIRYIKLDFMDDSAIEGYYFKPHTTAMQAQRIGLEVIREAVGPNVYLDKDGSVMLNPVGYVDYGRISQDTGHSFAASRDAATGIAARYYMNRNFFVSDPDAFTVSRQRITDQSWHEGLQPLTLDEAKVSIALAAVSGGMFEIGDDLPGLQNLPDRLALLENADLIDMLRLGRAAMPVDLMSYTDAARQPSTFYLQESRRQGILTVFNWTEVARTAKVRLEYLGLAQGDYAIADLFDHSQADAAQGWLSLTLPAHSVRMMKIVNRNEPLAPPAITTACPAAARVGESVEFTASAQTMRPAVSYLWSFGDGVALDGTQVSHAWTAAGLYHVRLTARGLDDAIGAQSCSIRITGYQPTQFVPQQIMRRTEK